MLTDRQGNALSGATPEAVALFDQAAEAFNIYRGDPVALVDGAIEAAPEFAMAHILKAYLYGLATEPEATAGAKEIVSAAKNVPLNEREASHLAALDRLLQGNWTASALALDTHCIRFPRDLVALQCGHLMDFFRANARDLRDRIARALPNWSPEVPGYPILLGMHAFGLEETGDYARARGSGTPGHRLGTLGLLGASRRGPRHGDAGPGPGWRRLDDHARAPLVGRRQLLQGAQLVAPGALSFGSGAGRQGAGPL